MPDPRYHDASALRQIAINLFYGWGYNFYRAENQVRADDILVRQKVSWLLGLAREILERGLADYRRRHLPLPTRAKPLPDPEALAAAERIADLTAAIRQLEGTVRTLPVPENDLMTRRLRAELDTLRRLCEFDVQLVGLAQLLHDDLTGKDHLWILANDATLREAVALMLNGAHARQGLLLNPDQVVGLPGGMKLQ